MKIIFQLDIINILVIVVAAISIFLGIFVYSQHRRNISNLFFFWLVFVVGLWGASLFAYRGAITQEDAVFFARLLYLSAGAIPFFFILFIVTFGVGKSDKKLIRFFLPIPFIFFSVISVIPGWLVKAVYFNLKRDPVTIFDQFWVIAYSFYILLYFFIGYFFLFKKLRSAQGTYRVQLMYILFGTLVSTTIGVVSNIILPIFGVYSLNWLGQAGVIVMIGAMSYSILEHNLFDIKIILTETLSFFLIFVLVAQLFLSTSLSQVIINSIVLGMVCGLLLWLVISVRNEIEQKNKIEEIAKNLEEANIHFRDLDQQKSEFVSIASHQLRTPLTAIKGYSSMILEGSFGKLLKKQREAVEKIFVSSNHLVGIVEDFLNITRIEQGRMSYQFGSVKLRGMIQSLIEEYSGRATLRNQKIDFIYDKEYQYEVTADDGKIRQVFSNLIDNAIKYTNEGGVVKIRLFKNIVKGKILVSVTDTGIGMSEKTLKLLFQKFSRAEDVQRLYSEGTGLGLYVASEMMKAHHGRIWAESEGEGKGSTFFVELMAEE